MSRSQAHVAEPETEVAEAPAEEAPPRLPLEDLVPDMSAHAVTAAAPREPSLRTARVVSVEGATCTIAWRGRDRQVAAEIAPEVDREVIVEAHQRGDSVLVEHVPGEAPLVVGVLQTRKPAEVTVKAATVRVEAERELLLRAGHAAIRLREDGEVEMVGSRMSVASRGLLKLVGRILRLN